MNRVMRLKLSRSELTVAAFLALAGFASAVVGLVERESIQR